MNPSLGSRVSAPADRSSGRRNPDVHEILIFLNWLRESLDGESQHLLALNEIYIGHQTHQSARYVLSTGTHSERQSSSGVIVATGTGATGWARSISRERQSQLDLPLNVDRRLAYFVREAWPSVSTGTTLTEGLLSQGEKLHITSEMEHGGVAFGDGIETDRILVGWGQEVIVSLASEKLRLVVG